MSGPIAALLPGNRLHLQHGPIDLIIGADGDLKCAFRAAQDRFQTILSELVDELPALRAELNLDAPHVTGQVAKRMDAVARPYMSETYVTRMAAVAGAVADTVLTAMVEGASLSRAYVNNGGDIAVHLTPGTAFSIGVSHHGGHALGTVTITHDDPVRGIATSGRHGRSLSLGIADSVTVLARTAAEADVAATLVANAADIPGHPGIKRARASDLRDDTDLGERMVVTGCAPLLFEDAAQALEAGLARAEAYRRKNRLFAAALFLQDEARITDTPQITVQQRTLADA